MIESLSQVWNDTKHNKLLEIISKIGSDISTYQMSLMYKALGDCYAMHHMPVRAIYAYEIGLKLNAKLPVKKKLKICQSEIGK